MLSRKRLLTLALAPAVLFAIEIACNRVPLLAPSGSTITLTSATSVLPVGGSATIIAQVVENAGTAPQAGTHVTFTTSLGTIQPSDATTDSSGRATATFTSTSSGTASISAISGGANTGNSPLKILVGTAAVQKVVVNASPATIPALGGSTTVSATVFDANGNLMGGVPVTFTTTAGTLSAGVVNTDANGVASATLTTAQTATVTASVGVGSSTTPTTPTTPPTTGTTPTAPSATGQASGTVTINIAAAPTVVITPPSTVPNAGLPANFTIAVTGATQNGSAIKDVTVDWGDTTSTDLGAISGNAVVAHVYSSAGSYTVKACAADAAGNNTCANTSVTVIAPAGDTIIITPTLPTTCSSSANVSLQIQVNVPTGVGVKDVTVDFGNNSTSDLGGLNGTTTIVHSYACGTNPTVTVTVKDTLDRTQTGTTSFKMP